MYYNFDYDWVHVEGDPEGTVLWLATKHFEVSGPYTHDRTTYGIDQQYAEIWELTYRRAGKKGAIGVGTGPTVWDEPITFDVTIG